MWCKQVERRNATKHKINYLRVLKSQFDTNQSEFIYLENRINKLNIMLKDSTYKL